MLNTDMWTSIFTTAWNVYNAMTFFTPANKVYIGITLSVQLPLNVNNSDETLHNLSIQLDCVHEKGYSQFELFQGR